MTYYIRPRGVKASYIFCSTMCLSEFASYKFYIFLWSVNCLLPAFQFVDQCSASYLSNSARSTLLSSGYAWILLNIYKKRGYSRIYNLTSTVFSFNTIKARCRPRQKQFRSKYVDGYEICFQRFFSMFYSYDKDCIVSTLSVQVNVFIFTDKIITAWIFLLHIPCQHIWYLR